MISKFALHLSDIKAQAMFVDITPFANRWEMCQVAVGRVGWIG